jgi:hypothetical protein
MAINEASVSRIRRFASQYNATHGRPPSPFQISAMLQAEIEADIARQQQGKALALQSRSLDINESLGKQRLGLMERELSNQESAAKMSGYGTAAMVGLIGAKEMGLTAPIGEAIKKGVSGLWGKTNAPTPSVGTGISAGTRGDMDLGWTFAGGGSQAIPTAGAAVGAGTTSGVLEGMPTATAGWGSVGGGVATETLPESTSMMSDIWRETWNTEQNASFLADAGCIIVTACTDRHSYEVEVARRYRDEKLKDDEYLGYYLIAPSVVSVIKRSRLAKRLVKRLLVDRLVDYGEWSLGMKKSRPRLMSAVVTKGFLALCRAALYRTLRKEYAHA